ncbi:MAG: hypothetical protein EOO61_20860, partial [Hymenobacter sp.]
MSFAAELMLGSSTYTIRRLQWSIRQEKDQLGRPNAIAHGGQLQIELDSVRDELLVNWMFHPRKTLDGVIRILRADTRAALKTIEFNKAFCVLLKGSFDANSTAKSMTKSLLISA